MAELPTRMTAIGIKAPGAPDMLVPEERPVPKPGAGEILVKVAAAGVNRPDVMQRQGNLSAAARRPGYSGPRDRRRGRRARARCATRWKIGDKVMALVIGGGYAEYALAHESHALPVGGLSMVEAAAVPETFFTVWHNVFERGALARKARRCWCTAAPPASAPPPSCWPRNSARASSPPRAPTEKCDACRKLGADVAINYKTEDFVAATKKATNDKGAELILDMVGGDYIARNYEAAAVEGRIVQIAFQGGPKAEVNFMRLMLKRLHHTGSTLRARSVADKGAIAKAIADNVLPLFAEGKAKPIIYKTFALQGCGQGPRADGKQRPHRKNRANRLMRASDILPEGAAKSAQSRAKWEHVVCGFSRARRAGGFWFDRRTVAHRRCRCAARAGGRRLRARSRPSTCGSTPPPSTSPPPPKC